MTERIVAGPCLTRARAARRAGISTAEVRLRPDLLRLGGTWLEETYFAFQFDGHGVRPDVGTVVQALKAEFDDEAIADWLVRPHPQLDHHSPLSWLRCGLPRARVAAAARGAGPVVDAVVAVRAVPEPPAVEERREVRRRRYRHAGVAPVH